VICITSCLFRWPRHETADAAIAYAIGKGWLVVEGDPPHIIRLTNEGRTGTTGRKVRQ